MRFGLHETLSLFLLKIIDAPNQICKKFLAWGDVSFETQKFSSDGLRRIPTAGSMLKCGVLDGSVVYIVVEMAQIYSISVEDKHSSFDGIEGGWKCLLRYVVR